MIIMLISGAIQRVLPERGSLMSEELPLLPDSDFSGNLRIGLGSHALRLCWANPQSLWHLDPAGHPLCGFYRKPAASHIGLSLPAR